MIEGDEEALPCTERDVHHLALTLSTKSGDQGNDTQLLPAWGGDRENLQVGEENRHGQDTRKGDGSHRGQRRGSIRGLSLYSGLG